LYQIKKKNYEFNQPRGLTTNDHYLYICNWGSDQIVVIKKLDYSLYTKWGDFGQENGQLFGPYSIYYNDAVLYIGDRFCVSLFTSDGEFLQRIGTKEKDGNKLFECAWGLCINKDKLYVSDYRNQRFQVFERIVS